MSSSSLKNKNHLLIMRVVLFCMFVLASNFCVLVQARAAVAMNELASQETKQGDFRLPKTANVFYPDGRVNIGQYRNYFWAVVRVETKSLGGCTGALVGKNLVLTAAHCIMKDGQLIDEPIYVKTGYLRGRHHTRSWVVHAWWGGTKPGEDRTTDWAILKLQHNLGDTFGYFGFRNSLSPFDSFNDGLNLAGFNTDRQGGHYLSRVRDCRIRHHYDNGMLLHDCDATRGSSGGPVYKCPKSGGCFIVCLAVSERRNGGAKSLYLNEYSHEKANICLHPKLWSEKIKELRASE